MRVHERLRRRLERRNESLSDHFQFKVLIAFHFKEKVCPSSTSTSSSTHPPTHLSTNCFFFHSIFHMIFHHYTYRNDNKITVSIIITTTTCPPPLNPHHLPTPTTKQPSSVYESYKVQQVMLTTLKQHMVWCGGLWWAVVWCGVVWWAVVCCGVVGCGVLWCGTVVQWYGVFVSEYMVFVILIASSSFISSLSHTSLSTTHRILLPALSTTI